MNNQQFSDPGDRPAPRRRARRRVSRRAGSPSAAAVASASAVEAAEALRPSSRRSDADGTSYPTTSRDDSDQPNSDQSRPGHSDTGSAGTGTATTGNAAEPSEHPSPAHTIPTPPSVAGTPTVAVAVTTSGIHPTTARLIALAGVYYDADGAEVGHFVQALNPGEDPGPWHTHGFDAGELAQQIGFATAAAEIKAALDGREVILHDAPFAWGFITHEFRRAQRAANRGRGRGRSGRGRGRGRSKAIPTPEPTALIDTLATTRRQEMPAVDPRPRAVAQLYPHNAPADALPEFGAAASDQRAATPAEELLVADARLLGALHVAQREKADRDGGDVVRLDPEDLTADQFGLQRSAIRIDAINAPRPLENPGTPDNDDGSWQLVAGMEFVVSPDVARDPDELIEQGMAAGLVYSEKLNRTSSLVVCNQNFELRGKAMHADRKDIPLLSDEEFLGALEDVAEGTRNTDADRGGGQRGGQRGGGGQRGNGQRSGSGGGRGGSAQRSGGRGGGRSGSSGSGSGSGNRRKRSRGGRRRSGGGSQGGGRNNDGAQNGSGSDSNQAGKNNSGGQKTDSKNPKNTGKNNSEQPKRKRKRGGRRRGRGGRGSNGQGSKTNVGKREN
ncbi:DNA polymerase III subunit epsilon [Corynebacterium urealyticum]|uniref:DNA polymerase III subunit epsilon n=1 Tax=Corynebacterium urealyticum TaxID=43771 RepID=A0A5D4FUA4_9CORY|nr:DNA polymerase III subunit epsilon [Corynebacterium urealyticum]TYR19603.1 DNA polymerase III subunit epsilon [Corynebacterium urealyticum]